LIGKQCLKQSDPFHVKRDKKIKSIICLMPENNIDFKSQSVCWT